MGDTLEASLRQAFGRSEGAFNPFWERPVSAILLAITVLLIIWPWLSGLFAKRVTPYENNSLHHR